MGRILDMNWQGERAVQILCPQGACGCQRCSSIGQDDAQADTHTSCDKGKVEVVCIGKHDTQAIFEGGQVDRFNIAIYNLSLTHI